MSQSVEGKLEALEKRLERAESELAIQRLLTRYGLAVDSGDAEATMSLFTPDCIFEVRSADTGLRDDKGRVFVMEGSKAVGDMVLSEGHQSLLPDAAHTIGPFAVHVDGDRAQATGYSRIYHREEGEYRLFRLAMNQWQFERRDGQWLIHRRTSQAIGQSDAAILMKNGLAVLK